MNSESSDLTREARDAPPMTDHDRMNYWWRRATQAERRIRDLTQEVRDERAACLDQMEQVQIRDARIKAVRDALSSHPRACEKHPDDDVIQCGWKSAVLDVQAALDDEQ